jgi:hypothetical protein
MANCLVSRLGHLPTAHLAKAVRQKTRKGGKCWKRPPPAGVQQTQAIDCRTFKPQTRRENQKMDDQLQQLIELQRKQNQLLERYLWRVRFSLLALLVLTTFVCCGLGLLIYLSSSPDPAAKYVHDVPNTVTRRLGSHRLRIGAHVIANRQVNDRQFDQQHF